MAGSKSEVTAAWDDAMEAELWEDAAREYARDEELERISEEGDYYSELAEREAELLWRE